MNQPAPSLPSISTSSLQPCFYNVVGLGIASGEKLGNTRWMFRPYRGSSPFGFNSLFLGNRRAK